MTLEPYSPGLLFVSSTIQRFCLHGSPISPCLALTSLVPAGGERFRVRSYAGDSLCAEQRRRGPDFANRDECLFPEAMWGFTSEVVEPRRIVDKDELPLRGVRSPGGESAFIAILGYVSPNKDLATFGGGGSVATIFRGGLKSIPTNDEWTRP
jgi:hypothetical protein